MKLVIYFIALFLGTGAESCPPCEMMIHASLEANRTFFD